MKTNYPIPEALSFNEQTEEIINIEVILYVC